MSLNGIRSLVGCNRDEYCYLNCLRFNGNTGSIVYSLEIRLKKAMDLGKMFLVGFFSLIDLLVILTTNLDRTIFHHNL